MVKVFITGATGYIGGDALYAIVQAHPEYDITALVRNSDKGALVAKEYPKVKLVYGDLDSADLLTKEALEADIVVHAASADHAGAANAIVTGIRSRATPGYYIHVSGTGILTIDDLSENKFGRALEKVYDDWKDIMAVTGIRDDASHRNVDKIVLAAGEGVGVKTAIVCPPAIYGPGRGPDNQRSMQAPDLAKITIEQGHGVVIEDGENRWTMVHVQDLSQVFLRLVEEAANGGGKATWGAEGYYFTESGEFTWGDVSKAIAKEAKKQKLIDTDEVKRVTAEEANKLLSYAGVLWGTNSRARAIRARKVLGWEPKERSLFEEIPDIVTAEAKAIGAIPGHAAKAAGDA